MRGRKRSLSKDGDPMILVGVGGNGSVVSLVLTGACRARANCTATPCADCQLAKELEPLDAIRLAHRLTQEALAIRRHDAATRPKRRRSGHVEVSKTERVLLKIQRLQYGIQSKQMAIDLGIAPQRFSNYETGARTVPHQVLEAWRQALGRE